MASLGCGSNSNSPAAPAGDAGAEGGAAITGLTAGTWKWVPIPGTTCRDGTETGIGVNLGTKTDHLMIYLQGGGACFNPTTCLFMNPSHFDATTFASTAGGEASLGIFKRSDATNPMKDWSFVFIPYCTGDIHAGNNPDGGIPTVGPQKFTGYANVGKDLERVVPTFPGVTQVLLTGVSAGGFGAAANYVQVASAFQSVPVYMLDDSGPAMEDPYNSTCLQSQVTALWGLDNGSLKDCGGECTKPASLQLDFLKHVAKTYPNVPFGLIESTEDMTIRQFYGFGTDNGANDCMGSIATVEDPAVFTAGLRDLEAQTAGLKNVGGYIIGANGAPMNTQHTSLIASLGESTPANGVPDSGTDLKLTDWITRFLAGTVTNVGMPPVAEAGADGGVADGGSD